MQSLKSFGNLWLVAREWQGNLGNIFKAILLYDAPSTLQPRPGTGGKGQGQGDCTNDHNATALILPGAIPPSHTPTWTIITPSSAVCYHWTSAVTITTSSPNANAPTESNSDKRTSLAMSGWHLSMKQQQTSTANKRSSSQFTAQFCRASRTPALSVTTQTSQSSVLSHFNEAKRSNAKEKK